jgi:RNA polymerase sigma-70 factor (ECF subfamily)
LNGHPEAYGQLVQRYQDPLRSYLAARLGDAERTEEAAQETFVRAFFALGKLKATGSFFSWLLGIASRVAKEQRRSERRQRLVIGRFARSLALPETSIDGDLRQAVANLPQPYAEVILLRYYGGVSCAEVAQQLGVPVGTVTKRLSRAYAMLRESLEDSERQQKPTKVQP